LLGNFNKYQKSIPAITATKSMFNQTQKEIEGIHIYPFDKIKQLA